MLRVILVNIVWIAAIFGAAEAGLAFLVSRDGPTGIGLLDRASENLYWRSATLIQFEPDCARYDPTYFYTLRPGRCMYESSGFSTTVTVNSAGLRDDEASLVAPEVIVAGDSQSMGWGVQDDEVYASILERETGLRVLNTAVSSYGTARELAMVQAMDLSALQALVIQYSANDDDENREFLEAGGVLTISERSVYDALVEKDVGEGTYYPLKHLHQTLIWLSGWFTQRSSAPQPAEVPPKESETEIDRFLKVISTASLQGHRPALVLISVDTFGPYPEFAQKLRDNPHLAALDDVFAEVRIVDSATFLETDDHIYRDGHINASGHRKVADAIRSALAELGVAN